MNIAPLNIVRFLRLAAASLLLLGGGIALPRAALAETTIRASGTQLLDDVNRGTAVIILELKDLQGSGDVGKRGVFLLQAANQLRLDIGVLKTATATANRRGPEVCTATRDALVSYGRLRATYQSLDLRRPKLDEAVRASSIAWASYTSYVILTKPKEKFGATRQEIDRTRAMVRRVHDRARAARAKVARNKVFARQFDRVVTSLRPYYGAHLTWSSYQAALADLALANGTYEALALLADRYDRAAADVITQQIAANDLQVWTDTFGPLFDNFNWSEFDSGFEVSSEVALDPAVVPAAMANASDEKLDDDVASIESALEAKPDDALPADDPDVADANGIDLDKTFECTATGCEDTPPINPDAATAESAASSDEPADDSAQPDKGADQNAAPGDDSAESPGTDDDNADGPDSNDDNADEPPAGNDDAAPNDDNGGGGNDDAGGSDDNGGGADDSGGGADDSGGGGDDGGGGGDDGN